MSRGLAFLSQKAFNPCNLENQKKKWIAEQKKKEEERRQKEALKQLQEEQLFLMQHKQAGMSAEELKKLKDRESLKFMYTPPPGYTDETKKTRKKKASNGEAAGQEDDVSEDPADDTPDRPEAKFAFLKNAPIEGTFAKTTISSATTHRPLGIQIRNVRCLRCGTWGHSSGDRECPMKDNNPNDHWRSGIEDPMRAMAPNAESTLTIQSRTVQYGGMRGLDPSTLEMVQSDDDSKEDAEAKFVASLTSEEKQKLLEYLEEHKEERKKKRERKEKKRHKRKRSRSPTPESDSHKRHKSDSHHHRQHHRH